MSINTQKNFFHWMMASEKIIHSMLNEVAMMLYTFQLEDVCSVKINYFSEKWKPLLTSVSY